MTEFPEIPEYGIGYDDDFSYDDAGWFSLTNLLKWEDKPLIFYD
jgi:hypothetical protein